MMTDTTKIAIDALEAKARELAEDRTEVRRKLLELSFQYNAIERDLTGCVAGAHALGSDISFPSVPIPAAKQQNFNNFHSWATAMGNLYATFKSEFGVEDDDVDGAVADDSRPEMPRIADIILERLKEAGQEGTKAADIRRYILRTYKSDIHEKTVGMTLNRMQASGQVRRDGRIWFMAFPESVAHAAAATKAGVA